VFVLLVLLVSGHGLVSTRQTEPTSQRDERVAPGAPLGQVASEGIKREVIHGNPLQRGAEAEYGQYA
jgi:hypothetical protein